MKNLGLSLLLTIAVTVAAPARDLPRPLPGHPGNVFVEGEVVTVPLPREDAWSLVDYDERNLRAVLATNGHAGLGRLAPGWYRLRGTRTNEWISLAVLPKPSLVPTNSPIGLDVAMSWFYPTNRMRDATSLCALAGVNWARDRLNWEEMEPEPGRFASSTRYDAAARIQRDAGLQVLQVNHISPKWANPNPKRFPADLRQVYQFYKSMAGRWKGQVAAFEPWNEADIREFGGHTGAEMASFQKAAYLGLKAGNPEVIACLNVWAVHRQAQLEDFVANRADAFFDTYNLHHYEPVDRYPALYADHRAASAGKPMWVTEFAMPVKWSGDEKVRELADADLRRQSERLVKAFAASLFEMPEASFYFMLPHYVEGQTQFGILRPDLTPRPAYVALSATARFLGSARPLGEFNTTNKNLRAYFFAAPRSTVIVAWSDAPASLPLSVPPRARYDHLGRPLAALPAGSAAPLSDAPQFIVLPAETADTKALRRPAGRPPRLDAAPASIVLQPLMMSDSTVLNKSAWRIGRAKKAGIRIGAYNFADAAVDVPLKLSLPLGWTAEFPHRLQLAKNDRAEIAIELTPDGPAGDSVETIKAVAGEGSNVAVLSMRVLLE